MSRIYWRIFMAFWAVIIVTTAITVGLGMVMLAQERDENQRAFLRASLAELAREGQQALDRGGEPALKAWLQARQPELPAQVLVLTPDGRELLDRPLPPAPARMLRRHADGPGGRGPPVRLLRPPGGGAEYVILPAPPARGPFGGWFKARGARPVFFLVLILVSGVVCLWLARYLTRPLDRLRQAGRSIAAGDLSARAGSAARQRTDEIGALARDFDQMAERVQQLVETQQRLLRDVSHELRSPLTRLQTAAGLLRQDDDARARPNLDRIDKEVRHLDELIGQILAYARLAQLQEPERSPVDLAVLLGRIVEDARYEGQAAGVEITLDAPARAAMDGELSLLHSALENVVRNAVQHANRRVSVQLGAEGSRWQVVVADDGPGADDAAMAQLFEPFYTGAESGGRGTGIGLAITRRAIALHGGDAQARNADVGGLEVRISLPAGS